MYKSEINTAMLGKILHGSGFGGLVDYANDPKKDARLIAASDGVNLTSNQSITDSFKLQAELSDRTRKPVAHFVLSLSPRDAGVIDDDLLNRIVHDYMNGMGYGDNLFVAFRHSDKKHPHVHIIVCRVKNDGKCTKDAKEKLKNVKLCRALTQKYGLYMAQGKEAVKENRLRSMDSIRFQMMHFIKRSLDAVGNWKDFQKELAKAGITCRFRVNTKTGGIEGISFTVARESIKDRNGRHNMRHDVSFSGKQLDESLTLACLCQKLGNPVAIAHEQARDMYDDIRQDWYDSHDYYEVQEIDRIFPDFDSLFPLQAKAGLNDAPEMDGSGMSFTPSLIQSIHECTEDIADAGNNCVYAGLQAMGELLLAPYQPALSAGGGGGGTSHMGWGDDDRYKKRNQCAYDRKRHGYGR